VNEWFASLGRLWVGAAERRGAKILPPALEPAVAEELLELARVAAHTKERRFAPLASFTAGLAVERLRTAKPGLSVDEAAALIREVREELEREAPPT
jgi:uncharacterized protein DUF6457